MAAGFDLPSSSVAVRARVRGSLTATDENGQTSDSQRKVACAGRASCCTARGSRKPPESSFTVRLTFRKLPIDGKAHVTILPYVVYEMETDIRFDDRIKLYEKDVRMVDGKSPAVSIDAGTRVYREIGMETNFRHWLRDVQIAFEGELIPFEWVADYVQVSRAALHKRIKRGGLTVLVYEMREFVAGILGGVRQRMRSEYKFVPRSECDSWRELLLERTESEE